MDCLSALGLPFWSLYPVGLIVFVIVAVVVVIVIAVNF